MDEYDVIAPFYDIEHARFDEDVDMYRNFAELSGGTILELACGSGRLMIPLAKDGYEVTGVDSSQRMLDLAEQAVKDAGVEKRCTLVRQDMSGLRLEKKFRMAFIGLGSFAHVTTRAAQQRSLAAIRAHMGKGATFIVDISNADARYMEDLGGQVLHQGTWQGEDGRYFTHFVSPATATGQHLLELTHFYDVHAQGGKVERTVVSTSLYLFERGEMELLLEGAGFAVKEVYGDHELGSFSLESPRMIFVAEAK